MREIEFSTMFDVGPSAEIDDGFFDSFTAQHQIKVKTHHLDWKDAWNQLIQFGLGSHGPDVSEIGSTWLGSFQTMESLRPFTRVETAILGDDEHFPRAAWRACHLHHDNTILAIPWGLDLRVVLYRRDWLQKAGVDEANAFGDVEQFHQTLCQLRAAGHTAPLGLTTFQTQTRLMQDLASWVWSAGGELRSEDGSRMLLMDARSRAGMQAYFGLNEFIAPEMQGLIETDVSHNFFKGKTAVAVLPENHYLDALTNEENWPAQVTENIGMAMLLKAPFLGGTSLVIWRHTVAYQDAIQLLKFLGSAKAWQMLNRDSRKGRARTPASLDALAQSPLAATPFYPAIQQSLKGCRSFHSGYRWNGVEGRLVPVIQQLWADLQANPELNIAQEIDRRFSSICSRLEQTILASSW